VIEAVGKAVIDTEAVAVMDEQPPEADTVYVTVYVPAVLRSGRIAPVEALMDSPPVEENVPPVVPDNDTAWALLSEVQYGVPL
jgi:hypothetical protein